MTLRKTFTFSCTFIALLGIGTRPTAHAEDKTKSNAKPTNAIKATATEKEPARYELDTSKPVEAQWQQYFDAAKANYEFTPEQTGIVQTILDSCISRATKLRKGSTVATAAEDKNLTAALNKLTDEFILRTDAVARLDQVSAARNKGFVSPREPVKPISPEVGNPAPAFTLKDTEGKEVSLESLRGKVTVLAFWSSWCGYCKKTMPDIQKLQDAYKDNDKVAILGVNCKERNKTAGIDAIQQNKYTFRNLMEGDATATLYEVQGIPVLYVVGPDGRVLHKQRGYVQDAFSAIKNIIENNIKKG